MSESVNAEFSDVAYCNRPPEPKLTHTYNAEYFGPHGQEYTQLELLKGSRKSALADEFKNLNSSFCSITIHLVPTGRTAVKAQKE
ncbi:hypothetical protein J6590_006563 [Homalodisca vitripennis]|nr:hypothetical protein J6590_006563 [Homalodisca vitripennis]